MDENYTQTQEPNVSCDLFKLLTSQLEAEVERRAEEKRKKIEEDQKPIPDGHRILTVVYNPNENKDDPEYVKLEVSPEDSNEGMNDAIALILAAVKILGKTCPGIQEDILSDDLLGMLADYMTGLLMKKLLGV